MSHADARSLPSSRQKIKRIEAIRPRPTDLELAFWGKWYNRRAMTIMNTALPEVTIYTDGACDPNPGPGGWAAVLRFGEHEKVLTGSEPSTTNNRMELQAVIGALTALKRSCRVQLHTDSEYVQKGVTQWLPRWKRNGWQTANRTPVLNQDLWQQLDEALQPHRIEWRWLKGHAGDPLNERVDRLAKGAIGR